MALARCLISLACLACVGAVQLHSQHRVEAAPQAERNTLQGCVFVEHTSVGSSVDGGWVNGWDNNMNFECPHGQVLAGAYSVHDNGREDRRWKMECVSFQVKTGYLTPYLQSCSWSGYTGWDAAWTAPSRGSNYVIVGVRSHHDNGREDRQYSFKSCAVADVDGNGQRSGMSGWQNSWDGPLDAKLSDTDFFGDWQSHHHNGAEDRQFAFDKTKFCYKAITASPTESPTDVPTSSPTRPAHDCLPWCAKDSRDWSEKCGWNVCNDCGDCGAVNCEQWCYNHDDHSWQEKCGWTNTCGGCQPCPHLTPVAAVQLDSQHRVEAAPRAMLKLNRKMPDDADVRQMYDDLANAGDDCVHFPISSDGCGAQECSKGTQHHVTCNWNSVPATVSGTAAPYTMKANGLVQASSSGCVTANSCVMGMFETTKYSSLCKGDTIEAIYSAAQGGDWFEVAMGLYEGTPGYNPTFVEKMIYRGSVVSNAVAKFTIPRSGDFFVRIFGASYDRTGGTVLGATLTLESEFEVVGACSVNGVTQQNANPPTPWPTPGPASSPAANPAAATGDPHLTDMNGEKFDVAKIGQMDFD